MSVRDIKTSHSTQNTLLQILPVSWDLWRNIHKTSAICLYFETFSISSQRDKVSIRVKRRQICPCNQTQWRSQRPRGLRRGSAAPRLLGLSIRIPPWDKDVFLLWMSCVVTKRSLRRADHPPRGVLPSVVCPVSLIARLRKERPWPGIVSKRHKEKKIKHNGMTAYYKKQRQNSNSSVPYNKAAIAGGSHRNDSVTEVSGTDTHGFSDLQSHNCAVEENWSLYCKNTAPSQEEPVHQTGKLGLDMSADRSPCPNNQTMVVQHVASHFTNFLSQLTDRVLTTDNTASLRKHKRLHCTNNHKSTLYTFFELTIIFLKRQKKNSDWKKTT